MLSLVKSLQNQPKTKTINERVQLCLVGSIFIYRQNQQTLQKVMHQEKLGLNNVLSINTNYYYNQLEQLADPQIKHKRANSVMNP